MGDRQRRQSKQDDSYDRRKRAGHDAPTSRRPSLRSAPPSTRAGHTGSEHHEHQRPAAAQAEEAVPEAQPEPGLCPRR